MVALIFIIDSRSIQVKVKESQISKLKKNPLRHTYIVQFCLSIPKNVICFDVRQLEMPKNVIQESDVITFSWFMGHCTARNKALA